MTAAVPHLSAEQLGITERELEALLWVRSLFVSGGVKHNKSFDIIGNNFNMGNWSCDMSCGSVRCIGGWMDHYLGKTHRSSIEEVGSHALFNLWYPRPLINWHDICIEAAVEAMDNVLLTGKPHWADIGRKYGYEFSESHR